MLDTILNYGLIFAMIFLSVTILFILLRALIGPRFTDRVLAINVINVKVIVLICILAFYFDENYVVDIAILYALFGFLSVIVLARIYLHDYLQKEKNKLNSEGEKRND